MFSLLKSRCVKLGTKISVPTTSLVSTQLKPSVKAFSKISISAEDVCSTIITFERSLCIYPLKVLAELHFRGLK